MASEQIRPFKQFEIQTVYSLRVYLRSGDEGTSHAITSPPLIVKLKSDQICDGLQVGQECHIMATYATTACVEWPQKEKKVIANTTQLKLELNCFAGEFDMRFEISCFNPIQ